jgi:hypothetical protein
MPKTKFQSVIFTLLMVFFMVYCMTVYTISLNAGALNYAAFGLAIREMWVEYAVVFCLVFFFITRAALYLSRRVSEGTHPTFAMLSTQFFTVCLVVPSITLFATFFHNGFSSQWFVQWVELAVKCFPMALCLQVALVGPFVRFAFRTIFKRQLNPAKSRVSVKAATAVSEGQ